LAQKRDGWANITPTLSMMAQPSLFTGKRHFAVEGHSWSPILAAIESIGAYGFLYQDDS